MLSWSKNYIATLCQNKRTNEKKNHFLFSFYQPAVLHLHLGMVRKSHQAKIYYHYQIITTKLINPVVFDVNGKN